MVLWHNHTLHSCLHACVVVLIVNSSYFLSEFDGELQQLHGTWDDTCIFYDWGHGHHTQWIFQPQPQLPNFNGVNLGSDMSILTHVVLNANPRIAFVWFLLQGLLQRSFCHRRKHCDRVSANCGTTVGEDIMKICIDLVLCYMHGSTVSETDQWCS